MFGFESNKNQCFNILGILLSFYQVCTRYILGQNKNRYTGYVDYFLCWAIRQDRMIEEYHMQVPGTDSRNLHY
jgi:hypothetical protein